LFFAPPSPFAFYGITMAFVPVFYALVCDDMLG
jgi:hypothetical protein